MASRTPGKAPYLAYLTQLQGRENLLPAERAAMARAAAEELLGESALPRDSTTLAAGDDEPSGTSPAP